MHSLGLTYHRDKVVGEIYFVVIYTKGALFEVGACCTRTGRMVFYDRYETKAKK